MSRRVLWLATLVALVACEKAVEERVTPAPMLEEVISSTVKNRIDDTVPATGAPVTLGADFGGTRAHIEMNADQTFARWIWKSGDSFGMYATSGSNWQTATFTTSGSGASADFSTSHAPTYDPPYYALFPKANKINTSNGHLLLGISIPKNQEAVAGGIKDGYTSAYALTQNASDFVHFKSLVSLVRFRMSGDVVSQVKSVTIKGAGPVAGDITFIVGDDGMISPSTSVTFTSDVASNTVTLSGVFEAGQDYYLVLRPGAQARFKMIFSNGAKLYTAKTANNFTFTEGQVYDFGTIALGNAFEEEETTYDPIKYKSATAGASKPVTIAVIGDGFTAAQQDLFVNLAKSAIDALLNTEPYKSYSTYFNAWILRADSKESGASVTDGNGTITTPVDTYFGAKWGTNSYGDMSAEDNTVFNFVSSNCPDIAGETPIHSINEVPILMIINDSRYGGICHSYSTGKGYGMVPYTDFGTSTLYWSYPNVTPSTNDPISSSQMSNNYHTTTTAELNELHRNSGDWRNTVVHEFGGHCFGRLGDEYWPNSQLTYESGPISSQTWTVPFSLNLAASPSSVTWQADVLNYPLETLVAKDPNYGRIGIFQGGGTVMFGRWRSEMISCMIDNRFYFSTWQRMLIVRRIMSLSGSTFDAASFWAKDVTTDPVRDVSSNPAPGDVRRRAVHEVPLLPPPVLNEEE